jgi:tripartite-type tricarboxylate transporter receptor subunit TctC
LAKDLTSVLQQQVIVENRPGASQSIAADHVAKSTPDGYTLLLVPSTILATALRKDLPYDLQRDLAPLYLLTTSAGVLVVSSKVPAKNIKELIALAKAKPGTLNYGSAGIGSPGHFAGELFNSMAGTDIKHIPFKGGAEAAVAAAAGEIEIAYPGVSGTPALVDSGKIRALAVTTKQRLAALPNVPTIDESGLPGFDYGSWHGLFLPKGVPQDIVTKLRAAIDKVVGSPEMAEGLKAQGYEPAPPTNPEQFREKLDKELKQTRELADKIGLKS